MDSPARQKAGPADNQPDVFGQMIASSSTRPTGTLIPPEQDLTLVPNRAQASALTAHAQGTTSVKTGVANPSQPTTCSQHGFKMALSYRQVEARDEVLDRRQRRRDGLLSKSADTSSSIYRVRHGSRPVDPASDAAYLPSGEGEEGNDVEREESQERIAIRVQERLVIPAPGLHAHGTPRRTNEKSLNAKAAKNKEIEEGLLKASEGRVTKEMLDIQPSKNMSQ
jgi:hypothetical protein